MKKLFLIAILASLFFSCKSSKKDDSPEQVTFDSAKWAVTDGDNFPFREAMANDIVYNKKFHGKHRNYVMAQLGEPYRQDSFYLYYTLRQRKIAGFITLGLHALVLKFRADSTVEWTKLYD